MDRRSYGRGQPRSSYRPRNLSSGNRSSNVGAHCEGGGDGYRSSLVSGNSLRDELDDGQRPGNLVGTCTLMCPGNFLYKKIDFCGKISWFLVIF
uniref:Uncharacterized protein n=1 Tax=Kalanchoe fedtschenkoi TaxID=63787 RepID=A0A7N0RBY8_KALFE